MTHQRRPCGECESCRWGGPCPSVAPYQGDALVDLNGGKGTLWTRTAQGWVPDRPAVAPGAATGRPGGAGGEDQAHTSASGRPGPSVAGTAADDPDTGRLAAALRRLARQLDGQ